MPGSMDGLGLAATVRDRWPAVMIIVTSGNLRPPAETFPDEEMFFPKPDYPEAIVCVINGLFIEESR